MRILYVTLGIVVADQATKLLVKGFEVSWLGIAHPGYDIGTSFSVIGDFLRLTYIENAGMAFGIDFGGKLFLTLFSIAASIGIFLYLLRIKNESFIVRLSLAMILGGAVGNLIDRIFYGVIFGYDRLFYGKVVDFVDIDFFNLDFVGITRWPVFNVADASVSIGVVLLLLFHRRFARASHDAGAAEKPSGAPVQSGIEAALEKPDPGSTST